MDKGDSEKREQDLDRNQAREVCSLAVQLPPPYNTPLDLTKVLHSELTSV